MIPNPIDEIRKIRRELSERLGNDIHLIAEETRRHEQESGRTYITLSSRPPEYHDTESNSPSCKTIAPHRNRAAFLVEPTVMEPAMDYSTLREWIDLEPFEPFRLVMTDGRSFEIRYPNMIWPARTNVLIGMPDNPSEPDVPARHSTVSMLHIIRLEPLNQSATAG